MLTTVNSVTCLPRMLFMLPFQEKLILLLDSGTTSSHLCQFETVVAKRKKIDIEGELWWNVLEATGQPISMKNP